MDDDLRKLEALREQGGCKSIMDPVTGDIFLVSPTGGPCDQPVPVEAPSFISPTPVRTPPESRLQEPSHLTVGNDEITLDCSNTAFFLPDLLGIYGFLPPEDIVTVAENTVEITVPWSSLNVLSTVELNHLRILEADNVLDFSEFTNPAWWSDNSLQQELSRLSGLSMAALDELRVVLQAAKAQANSRAGNQAAPTLPCRWGNRALFVSCDPVYETYVGGDTEQVNVNPPDASFPFVTVDAGEYVSLVGTLDAEQEAINTVQAQLDCRFPNDPTTVSCKTLLGASDNSPEEDFLNTGAAVEGQLVNDMLEWTTISAGVDPFDTIEGEKHLISEATVEAGVFWAETTEAANELAESAARAQLSCFYVNEATSVSCEVDENGYDLGCETYTQQEAFDALEGGAVNIPLEEGGPTVGKTVEVRSGWVVDRVSIQQATSLAEQLAGTFLECVWRNSYEGVVVCPSTPSQLPEGSGPFMIHLSDDAAIPLTRPDSNAWEVDDLWGSSETGEVRRIKEVSPTVTELLFTMSPDDLSSVTAPKLWKQLVQPSNADEGDLWVSDSSSGIWLLYGPVDNNGVWGSPVLTSIGLPGEGAELPVSVGPLFSDVQPLPDCELKALAELQAYCTVCNPCIPPTCPPTRFEDSGGLPLSSPEPVPLSCDEYPLRPDYFEEDGPLHGTKLSQNSRTLGIPAGVVCGLDEASVISLAESLANLPLQLGEQGEDFCLYGNDELKLNCAQKHAGEDGVEQLIDSTLEVVIPANTIMLPVDPAAPAEGKTPNQIARELAESMLVCKFGNAPATGNCITCSCLGSDPTNPPSQSTFEDCLQDLATAAGIATETSMPDGLCGNSSGSPIQVTIEAACNCEGYLTHMSYASTQACLEAERGTGNNTVGSNPAITNADDYRMCRAVGDLVEVIEGLQFKKATTPSLLYVNLQGGESVVGHVAGNEVISLTAADANSIATSLAQGRTQCQFVNLAVECSAESESSAVPFGLQTHNLSTANATAEALALLECADTAEKPISGMGYPSGGGGDFQTQVETCFLPSVTQLHMSTSSAGSYAAGAEIFGGGVNQSNAGNTECCELGCGEGGNPENTMELNDPEDPSFDPDKPPMAQAWIKELLESVENSSGAYQVFCKHPDDADGNYNGKLLYEICICLGVIVEIRPGNDDSEDASACKCTEILGQTSIDCSDAVKAGQGVIIQDSTSGNGEKITRLYQSPSADGLAVDYTYRGPEGALGLGFYETYVVVAGQPGLAKVYMTKPYDPDAPPPGYNDDDPAHDNNLAEEPV